MNAHPGIGGVFQRDLCRWETFDDQIAFDWSLELRLIFMQLAGGLGDCVHFCHFRRAKEHPSEYFQEWRGGTADHGLVVGLTLGVI